MIDILVVDDDVRVAGINAAYVGRVPGFRVVGTAHTAAEALAFLERTAVDLVLLDHYLPDGTGLALVRRLRQRGHHTDVIMVTAARDIATVQAAMRHGALQYLVKPFTFAGLRAKLDGYAALRRALDSSGEAEQAQVDRIFGALGAPPAGAAAGAAAAGAQLPKGHSALTADLVREVLRGADGPLSAQEVAERSGLSRQTAQRYLKLLERAGRVRMSLKYGETGHPEHRYVWDRDRTLG
ncbi:response regulator [Streptomyces sp. KR80]|uniref:response regulator n=1 Tax=Streptomyces sp. KR80 TaxID=3457426 RepID=UPI003FD56CE3